MKKTKTTCRGKCVLVPVHFLFQSGQSKKEQPSEQQTELLSNIFQWSKKSPFLLVIAQSLAQTSLVPYGIMECERKRLEQLIHGGIPFSGSEFIVIRFLGENKAFRSRCDTEFSTVKGLKFHEVIEFFANIALECAYPAVSAIAAVSAALEADTAALGRAIRISICRALMLRPNGVVSSSWVHDICTEDDKTTAIDEEEEQKRAVQEEEKRVLKEKQWLAEEEQRRRAEEEQRRRAEEEQRKRAEEEQRRAEEAAHLAKEAAYRAEKAARLAEKAARLDEKAARLAARSAVAAARRADPEYCIKRQQTDENTRPFISALSKWKVVSGHKGVMDLLHHILGGVSKVFLFPRTFQCYLVPPEEPPKVSIFKRQYVGEKNVQIMGIMQNIAATKYLETLDENFITYLKKSVNAVLQLPDKMVIFNLFINRIIQLNRAGTQVKP